MKLWQWLVTLVLGRLLRRRGKSESEEPEQPERIVPAGIPERRAENAVLVLLGIASLFALGFVVTYALFSPSRLPNELLGICLGMCLVFIGAALTVVAKRLVVTEQLEEESPQEHPRPQQELAEIVHQSGRRIPRKRMPLTAGAATGGALGLAAAVVPLRPARCCWES